MKKKKTAKRRTREDLLFEVESLYKKINKLQEQIDELEYELSGCRCDDQIPDIDPEEFEALQEEVAEMNSHNEVLQKTIKELEEKNEELEEKNALLEKEADENIREAMQEISDIAGRF